MKKNVNEHIFFKNIFLSYCIFLYNQTINEEIIKHIDHALTELKIVDIVEKIFKSNNHHGFAFFELSSRR